MEDNKKEIIAKSIKIEDKLVEPLDIKLFPGMLSYVRKLNDELKKEEEK